MGNYSINGSVMILQSLTYPELNSFSECTSLLLMRANNALKGHFFSVATHDDLKGKVARMIVKERLNILEHRLSKYANKKMSNNDHCNSETERHAISIFENNFTSCLHSYKYFRHALKVIGGHINGRTVEFRAGKIRSVADDDGSCTEFLGIEYVPCALNDLRKFIIANSDKNPIFTAIVASVMFIHCHPLPDGNGRCSRVLFNLILKRNADNFIPLTEICHYARSGYILSLREALFFSEWEAIINYFCETMLLINDDF